MLNPAVRRAIVAAKCNDLGFRLDAEDVVVLVALLDDLEDLVIALDEAGVDTHDRAEGVAATAYDLTGRIKALVRDRNNARDMRAQTLETLKVTIAERDAIAAGPKGAAWASLRQTSSLVAVQAAKLEAEVVELKKQNERLRTTSTEIVTDEGRLSVVMRAPSFMGQPIEKVNAIATDGTATTLPAIDRQEIAAVSSTTTADVVPEVVTEDPYTDLGF